MHNVCVLFENAQRSRTQNGGPSVNNLRGFALVRHGPQKPSLADNPCYISWSHSQSTSADSSADSRPYIQLIRYPASSSCFFCKPPTLLFWLLLFKAGQHQLVPYMQPSVLSHTSSLCCFGLPSLPASSASHTANHLPSSSWFLSSGTSWWPTFILVIFIADQNVSDTLSVFADEVMFCHVGQLPSSQWFNPGYYTNKWPNGTLAGN